MTTSRCGLTLPLSASVGGGPVLITSTAEPGQVVHANPVDSGGIDAFSPLVIVNPNPSTVTLYKAVTGPSIPTPVWHRHDIPATNEGQEPTRIVTPTVLEADFNLSMYVEPLPGYQPILVYGNVERSGSDTGGTPIESFPGMWLGGTADSFTLNSTESKIQNYTDAGEWNWPDLEDIDPVNGEITIPKSGIYSVNFIVIGDQGNSTKEEWIEARMKIDLVGGGTETVRFDILDVTTDKTSARALGKSVTRVFQEDEKLSLWLWASSGLGTFTITGCTFEVEAKADESSLITP